MIGWFLAVVIIQGALSYECYGKANINQAANIVKECLSTDATCLSKWVLCYKTRGFDLLVDTFYYWEYMNCVNKTILCLTVACD